MKKVPVAKSENGTMAARNGACSTTPPCRAMRSRAPRLHAFRSLTSATYLFGFIRICSEGGQAVQEVRSLQSYQ